MIEAHQLTRTFRSGGKTVEAVKGIDLRVAPGELLAFLGPNGAGKSTTLRMLTSLLPPTSGTATVAGVDVVADPAGVRARIGYIGQKDGAGQNYRVLDELIMQGRFYGLSAGESRARAAELIAALDLAGMERRKVSTLSGGQKRRLDIALGLIHRPGILFLDEPSTGMDPQSRANLWEHIMAIRDRDGTTIVLTTHYLEEADAMAERVVIVDHGTVIADDTPTALKRDRAGDRVTILTTRVAAEEARALLLRHGDDVEERLRAGEAEFEVRVEDGPAALPGIVRAAEHADVPVLAASSHRPTLDDVFLGLTGRSLREGAEA